MALMIFLATVPYVATGSQAAFLGQPVSNTLAVWVTRGLFISGVVTVRLDIPSYLIGVGACIVTRRWPWDPTPVITADCAGYPSVSVTTQLTQMEW